MHATTRQLNRVASASAREGSLMLQNPSSADDEGIQLTYSTLTPQQRSSTPFAAPAHDAEPEPRPVRGSQAALHRSYRRPLNAALLGAVLALGMLLGTVMSGYAAPLRSSPLSSRPSVHAPPTPVAIVGGGQGTAATPDARFAIVTLGIQCLPDTCNGTLYVSAGQRIYALGGGASCTTTDAAEIVGRRDQYVYCRLDQPDVFTATFDGAQFDCVGSRLGCHFLLLVETTNGR